MQRLLVLVLSIFLSACATMGADQIAKMPAETKIVPLSLMGNDLTIKYVGTTVFTNAQNNLNVSDWKIDQHIEAKTVEIINSSKKLTAVATDSETARQQVGSLGSDFWTGKSTIQGGADSMIKFASDSGADYILTFSPASLGDPFYGTNQQINGYGIYERSMFSSKKAINFLTMCLVLFDGKTGKEIARTCGFLDTLRSSPDWMDHEKLQPDEANIRSTKVQIEKLIDQFLHKTLTALKLAD